MFRSDREGMHQYWINTYSTVSDCLIGRYCSPPPLVDDTPPSWRPPLTFNTHSLYTNPSLPPLSYIKSKFQSCCVPTLYFLPSRSIVVFGVRKLLIPCSPPPFVSSSTPELSTSRQRALQAVTTRFRICETFIEILYWICKVGFRLLFCLLRTFYLPPFYFIHSIYHSSSSSSYSYDMIRQG